MTRTTNDAPVTVQALEMQAHRLDRIREDNDKPTLTDYAVLRETADMLRRLAALVPALALDENSAIAFVRRIADMVGDELDAHASPELRDAARAVIASEDVGLIEAARDLLHARERLGGAVAFRADLWACLEANLPLHSPPAKIERQP